VEVQEDLPSEFDAAVAHLSNCELAGVAINALKLLAKRHGMSYEAEVAAFHDGLFVYQHAHDEATAQGHALAFATLRQLVRDHAPTLRTFASLAHHAAPADTSDIRH
jgi:hypothetical protein